MTLSSSNIRVFNSHPQFNFDITGIANVSDNLYVNNCLGVGTQTPIGVEIHDTVLNITESRSNYRPTL